ncbi:hypothetical protein HPB49_024095 [Dermacentor silvarum]|uniref:Uncharacterized protein n=1 Tax=Dermacentor silvarum TaxID=543639 RepID=A0ACB8CC10_DERSI|nr:uncharacterized protein LOC119461325 [Dermacentor silvarum]KAH7938476.1 hypothetical protein HPB49_024095 [Dermacentor silvarum]
MAQASATALRNTGAPVLEIARPAEQLDDPVAGLKEQPTPNLKELDRRRQLGNRVTREDSKKKKQSASVRPRQVHHAVARRPAGPNHSSRMVVDRPLNGGSSRRRPGDQGFSAFLEQCKRLLVTASYRGSVKNPLDALGVVFLSFLAARFPLEQHFLRRQKSRAGVGGSATAGSRKPRAIEDHSPMSDAVLLSVDKVTRKARCTTVQVGQGRQAAATKVGEPDTAKASDGGVSKHRQKPEHKAKPVEEFVPVLTLPQAADVFQHMAGFLGPAILQAGKGTSFVPGSAERQQRCPRFGRGFLAIRHSASVFQTEEWKPRGRTLYQPLTNDMMINALSVDQLSFESGQFFLADGKGNYAGAKSGHAIHFWRYNNVDKRLFVSQSVFFLNEEDYTGVLEQLEYI